MDVLSIYTLNRNSGGYYGLCKKTVTKQRLIVAHREYGYICLINGVSMLGNKWLYNLIDRGDAKLEMKVRVTSSAMARFIGI